MALGLREAEQIPPVENLPQANPRDSDQNVLPYSAYIQKLRPGPSDPLAGPTSPDDIAGLVTSSDKVVALLEKILIATRAQHPNMTIPVIGETTLQPANSGQELKFEIGGKKVTALNTIIQNNTGAIIYVTIDDPPSLQGLQVPANGGILKISDVAVHFLGIYVTAQTLINGLSNIGLPSSGFSVSNMTIMGWGNSEWGNVWGMTS